VRIPVDSVRRAIVPRLLLKKRTDAEVPAHVEMRDGVPVIVTDRPMKPLTVESTRAAIDRSRR
jgi:hypothetical protein